MRRISASNRTNELRSVDQEGNRYATEEWLDEVPVKPYDIDRLIR